MAHEAKPTNEHIIELLDRVLEELGDLGSQQRQIEDEIKRLVDATSS